MKKLLRSIVMALMLLCTLTLVACQENDPKLTDQDVVNAAKEAFTINYTEVTTDFTLPTTAAGGVTVTWASSDAAIAISGQNAAVTRPAFADGNKNVVLTATLAKNDATATKEFTVVVVCLEDANTIEALTVAEARAAAKDETVTVKGVVSGFHIGSQEYPDSVQGCYITDETGSVYVYSYELAEAVEKGDEVIIKAKVGEYKGNLQLTYPTELVQTVSKGNTVSSAAAITDKTVADIAADLTASFASQAYVFEGVHIVKVETSTYKSYTIEDASGNVINLYSGGNSSEFAAYDEYIGKELKVLFYVNSQNSKGTKWRGHILDIIEVVGDWSGSNNGGGSSTVTGTEETIANLLAAAGALESGAKLEGNFQTTGTVKSIEDAYSSQYKNITFILTDGTNDIECYRTKGDLAASIAVGDTVTVVGEVQNYNGKVEFAMATITARTAGEGGGNQGGNEGGNTGDTTTVAGVLSATASLAEEQTSAETYTVTGVVTGISEAYNSQYGNVSFYLSDGTAEILVYRATGAEAANLAKTDTVTITGKIKNYYGTFEFVNTTIDSRVAGEGSKEEAATATITFEVANRTSWDSSSQIWAQNGITVTNNKASSTSPVADYSNPARFYKSSSLTIEYTENITKIVITTSGDKCYAATDTISGATLTVSAGQMIIELDTPATSFTIATLLTQVRASKIEVFTAAE